MRTLFSAGDGLASTAALLASGGDERLALDAGSGRSRHGCRPLPDDTLVALGSATASNISAFGYAAADALRQRCAALLRTQDAQQVYAQAAALQRQALLRHCGCLPSDGVEAVLAASGTDVLLLAARLCQPRCSILIAAPETGSGVPLALQGRHFNRQSTDGVPHEPGLPAGAWHGTTTLVAPRLQDGSLRDADQVDAAYSDAVAAAVAAAGGTLLLVLTDVSKTGLISPGIATVLRLQARWPGRLRVLVDACQFRLSPHTVRAYLRLGWMVALTGSKFMSGPTYSGALLLPAPLAAVAAVAKVATVATPLQPSWPNFGLLLRWEAALAEMARLAQVPQAAQLAYASCFAEAVRAAMAERPEFQLLEVAPLDRTALGTPPSWDAVQTIFPFMLKGADGRALGAAPMQAIYRRLQAAGHGERRFQLGQPVLWTAADGGNMAALRLCLGARMIVDLHAGGADPAAAPRAATSATGGATGGATPGAKLSDLIGAALDAVVATSRTLDG